MNDTEERDEKLAVRAAWYYYIEGQTQERIAKQLDISRVKVARLLATARDTGLVQFRINSKLANCVALENQLKRLYGLIDAVVVPTPIDADNVNAVIGQAAGSYLSEFITDGMAVGIGWGRTLEFATRALSPRQLQNATVVSLLGGITHAHGLNPTECAWRFANKLNADCYLLMAPVYAADAYLRDALLAQKGLQEVMARASRIDVAVISVGDLSPSAPIIRYGFLEQREFDELRSQGAVGDVLCHFISADGAVLKHPVNSRVSAFPPEKLARIAHVIIASGGRQKVNTLYGALSLTHASILITDEESAESLIARASTVRQEVGAVNLQKHATAAPNPD